QVNEPTILSASGVATAVSCNGGSDASIDLAVVGGTASYTYLWSNGATTEDLSGLTAGTYDVTVTDANGCTATASIQVNEPTILSASGVATAVSCNGGSDASIDLAVVGGTASYTYLWSNGATTEDLSGLTAGTYDVTVTDANGCTATASIQVNEPTILSASGVATAVSCNGGSDASIDLAVVGGTASYTYLWSNGATTEDLSGLTAGTYDVTVTDANGCTATASIQVNEPTILTASGVATAVSCNGGSDASIDLAVVGGTKPYTYAWNNGATTEDLSGLTAGTYDVTVTDANGCTATASFVIEIIDSSSPLALTRDISVNLDANGAALITAGDIDNGSYDNCSIASLAIDQTEFSCSTLGENTVTLTVTDTNGNVSTATAVVTVTGCAQQGITFEDESFTYDGTVHALAVNNLPTDATVRYTNNEKIDAGVYTVEAVVTRPYYLDLILTASLSIEQASQSISFDALPMVSLETDPDFQLEVTASSGLPVSYSYTYSSTVPAAMVSESGFVSLVQSGTITITATQAGNENYQPATPVSQEFIVTSADASITRLTIGDSEYLNPDAIITYVIDCGEDVQTLNVTYETEANATGNMPKTFSVPVPQPGIYRTTLVVSSQDGMVSRTYTIEIHKRFLFGEIVVQKFNNTLVVNNNPQTNGGYRFTGYQWYKNGRRIGNEQYFSEGDFSTDMLDPFASYRVELITAGGDVLSTCAFNIELQASGKIHLAPNPVRATSSATLFAEFDREELKDMKISIHSLQGTLVDTFYTSGSSTTVQMPAGIQAGVYVLVCETKKQTQTIQFIVN
ncbi:T9SS type A sorting domain-containing protein, partial [Leeuwenhoekiella aequorea]|uniref:T9SS type A sorting domain-containing protein n=1 Tax=Leeuwenhoekiella aequorea TaxID=283736 RepID=UPI00352E093C